MNDLIDRLSALSLETAAPSDATVAADVRRGRRARLRHRAVRGATGGVLALALGGTALALHTGDGAAPEASQRTSDSGIHLVDYTGPQQPGFTVQTVPEGYVVQGVRPNVLDITKPGDTSSLNSFVGKIAIMLQSNDATFRKVGTQVSVNGRAGYIHDEPGVATSLEFHDAAGHDVIVQAWDDLGLTDDQLVQLAEGVTVSSAAVASDG
jgi:hypothetical protein